MSFYEWHKKQKNKNAPTFTQGKKNEGFYEWDRTRLGVTEEEKDSALAWRNDEIAPTNDVWFKSGGGNFVENLGGSVLDFMIGVEKGGMRTLEGIGDAILYGAAGISEAYGDEEKADEIRRKAQKSQTDDYFKMHKFSNTSIDEFADKYSVLGNKSDAVAEGIGQVALMIATGGAGSAAGLGTVGTTVLTTGGIGISGLGSGMSEAYAGGATDEEAFKYGALKGGIEAGTELMFAGLGGTTKAIGIGKSGIPLDDFLANAATKKITNQTAKNLVKYGIKATGEGVEEVVAGYLTAHAKKGTYMAEEDFSEILKDERLLESFITGVLTSAIAQSGDLTNSIRTGRDFVTGYTRDEQSVIDKEVANRVAEIEKDGTKLKKREIGKIEEAVKNDLEKGYISTDVIESVLGGEEYKAYKNTVDSEEALKKELAELQKMEYGKMNDVQHTRLNELKGLNLNDTTKRDSLKAKLDEKISPLLKNSMLAESYNEKARKSQAFEADLTKYKGKQREAVERAINSGVLNNTNRTHELVNILSKIEADKGIVFDYANNEKLKESGFALEGVTVNGFANKSKGTVTLNVQSAKAWQSVVGHEITHILEGTDSYGALQEALFKYADSKSELKSRRDNLTELYNGVDTDIDAELTADLVGDYLFSDSNFIKNLTTNKNLFQKIWNEVKYLCKVATGKQLTEIEKVEREFAKAWKELSVNQNAESSGNVNYSISEDNAGNTLTDGQQEFFAKSKLRDENGRLLRLYHGTENGGFTKFLSKYSDDGISLFLAKDKALAQTYSGSDSKIQLPEAKQGFARLFEKGTDKGNGQAGIYEVFANAENPYVLDCNGANWNALPFNEKIKGKTIVNFKSTFDTQNNVITSNVTIDGKNYNKEFDLNHLVDQANERIIKQQNRGLETDLQYELKYLAQQEVLDYYKTIADEDLATRLTNRTLRSIIESDNVISFTGTVDNKTGDVTALNTRAVAKWAKKNGYDAVIFKNVQDSGAAGDGNIIGDVIVVYDGAQIKSADNLNPTKNKDIRYSVSKDSQGNELSLAVQKRFANSKAVDENGNLKVLYHGTANGEFYTFDKSKGNVEGDFGSGFYFTDSEYDVENNYEGGGADFDNKVARLAEQIESEEGIDYHEAEARAKKELYVGSNKHTVYLNIENPAIVGETNLFDYDSFADEVVREDYDSDEDYEYGIEEHIAEQIDEIIWDIQRNVDVYSTDGIAEVLWNAINEGGIDIEQLKANINNLYLEDSNGNLVGNEVTRQIIESLGYDGIIDNTVSSKFNMNLAEGTTHYIVFKPNQIKSIDNQNPTDNPDIRYSLSGGKLDNGNGLVYNGKRGEGYVATDEFRNLQAECQEMSDGDIQLYHAGNKQIDDGLRERFSRSVKSVFLESKNNGISNDKGLLNLTSKNNNFNMHEGVSGSLFHDVFEMARNHLKYGELVDLHEIETTKDGIGYNDCYNYLSDDGLSGFSITPDGDLISVFNASGKSGFLRAIAPVVKEKAKTLDCYASENQNLMGMYSTIFGFKAASVMDYNMEYDHDNIAKNHGMPQIAFMVNTQSNVETKQFTEEQYDEAVAYRNGFVMSENIAPVQNSLSNANEDIAPVGTPLKDLYFAPAQETVAENETVDNSVADDAINEAPLPTDEDAPPEVEHYNSPDTTAIDEKSLKNIGKTLQEVLMLTPQEAKVIQDVVQEYSTTELPSKAELFEKIKNKFGTKEWRQKNADTAEAKKALKDYKISVPQNVRASISDYSNFSKSYRGKIGFSKYGMPIDTAYAELSEQYPSFFPADVTTETDQLLKMAEVADMQTFDVFTDELSDATIQNAVDIIANNVTAYKQNLTKQAAEDTAREALDSIAPLKAEQIMNGTRGDALLLDSLDNYPIKTVEDRTAEKLRAVEAELTDNKHLRREAENNYNVQIAELEKQYAGLKDKSTKKANNLVQRVLRLERLKASVDAEYAKRISDLEARIEKMNDPKYSRAMNKQAKMQEHAKWAENLLGDTSTWVDKKIGLQYATNTERRNLRDIVRDANGNKDIAKADAIDDALNGQYNREEAAKKRELTKIRSKYAELKITKAEDTYIQMLGELRSNPDTTLTEKVVNEFYEANINKIDKAKVEKVLEYARQDYDSLLERVNAVLKAQGMKEIPYRKGYFPHFTEPKQNFVQKLLNWKTQDNEIPTSIAGLTEDFKPVKKYQSFDKRRYGDTTDYSFTKGFDTYSDGALDWIYHLETLQKRRAVENYIRSTHSDEGIQARIKEVYANEELDANEAQAQIEQILAEAKNPLNNFVQDFTTHTNVLAGKKNSLDRAVEQATNRKIYSTMTNIQNRLSANMVLGNVRSALTNFIPITQSWAQVSPLRSLQAAKDTIANAIKDDGTIDKSTFLTNRLKNPDNLYKTNWDKILDGAGIMFEIVDNFSSQVVWRSKYNQNLANGMSESQAIKNADQFAENVLAGRSKGNEPTIFTAKNPFVKAFTMFQLEVNNQYGYLFKDVPNDLKTETNHWKLNLAKGYTTAFVGAYIYDELLTMLTGSGAAFNPLGIIKDLLRDLGLFDEEEEKEPDEIMTNLADNIVEELPFIGGLFGGGRVPISSALPYGGEYGGGLSGAIEDISEGDWESIGKEMMNPFLNIVLPVGGNQIKKTYQGLSMFNTDEEHPIAGSYTDSGNLRFPVEDTFGNRLQAGIFGQYANENARTYFDNGYAPLKEKQIQEYSDVELPIADYWKYRDGLKGLKTNAEKADYINSLNIETWQKNLLMNNILDREEDVDMSNYGDYGSFDEFDYAQKNPEKYEFFKANGISYSDYANADEDGKAAYTWAYNNPEKYTLSKAVTNDVIQYRKYTSEMYDIKADKDSNGKSISGSRKEKIINYINSLDADYGTKIILFRYEYQSDDTYNADIINYINNRTDLTYEERVTIFTELGFIVKNGYVYWN